MNLYEVCPENNPFGDYKRFVWHIAAENRAKAKAVFIKYWNEFDSGYEYTDKFTIKTLVKNINMEKGFDWEYKWAKDNGYPESFFESVKCP